LTYARPLRENPRESRRTRSPAAKSVLCRRLPTRFSFDFEDTVVSK
jgi:hypothetical protein